MSGTTKTRPFREFQTRVERIEALTPRVRGIRLHISDEQTLSFRPGQFAQIVVPFNGEARRTSYSIASPSFQNNMIDLCVTLVQGGVSSNYIHDLKEGDEVRVIAPFGRFVLPEKLERDLVFISTGSGIAPFRSMIQDLLHWKVDRSIRLVFGNRHEEDIIYRSEWEALAREHSNFEVVLTLSRPGPTWPGAKGYVQEQLAGIDPDVNDFFICGLVKMIDDVKAALIRLGVPEARIHYERYD